MDKGHRRGRAPHRPKATAIRAEIVMNRPLSLYPLPKTPTRALGLADSRDPWETGGHKKKESVNDLEVSNTPIAPPKVGWRIIEYSQKSPGTSFEAGPGVPAIQAGNLPQSWFLGTLGIEKNDS